MTDDRYGRKKLLHSIAQKPVCLIYICEKRSCMNNIVPVPRYTYEDYAQRKEDWQLINGYPYQLLPSAKWKHTDVQVRLSRQAGNQFDKNKNCNCMVFTELD